jgi:hypothetical protein
MDIVHDLDQNNLDVNNFGKSFEKNVKNVKSEKIKKYSFQTSLKNHPLSYLNDLNHQNVTGNQFLEPSANQRLDDIMRVFDAMDELIQEQADYDQNNNPEWVFGTTLADEAVIAQNLPGKYMERLRRDLESAEVRWGGDNEKIGGNDDERCLFYSRYY